MTLKAKELASSSKPAPDQGYGSLHSGMKRFKKPAVLSALAFLMLPALAPIFESSEVRAQDGTNESVPGNIDNQNIIVDSELLFADAERDGYTAQEPSVSMVRVPKSTNADVAAAQEYAFTLVQAKGWGVDQYNCLVKLWHRESGWRYDAANRSSGAYGIPQALPGKKMASAGADWQTNPETQIRWGMGYVQNRYGTPCGAWGFFQTKGWY
ncbi:MAG: lytic transglycosylase domain-containing protein [Microbacteriaceae bacterium]